MKYCSNLQQAIEAYSVEAGDSSLTNLLLTGLSDPQLRKEVIIYVRKHEEISINQLGNKVVGCEKQNMELTEFTSCLSNHTPQPSNKSEVIGGAALNAPNHKVFPSQNTQPACGAPTAMSCRGCGDGYYRSSCPFLN